MFAVFLPFIPSEKLHTLKLSSNPTERATATYHLLKVLGGAENAYCNSKLWSIKMLHATSDWGEGHKILNFTDVVWS